MWAAIFELLRQVFTLGLAGTKQEREAAKLEKLAQREMDRLDFQAVNDAWENGIVAGWQTQINFLVERVKALEDERQRSHEEWHAERNETRAKFLELELKNEICQKHARDDARKIEALEFEIKRLNQRIEAMEEESKRSHDQPEIGRQ